MVATDFPNQQTFAGTLQRDLHSSNILDNLMALSAAAELVGAEIIPLSEFRLFMPIKQLLKPLPANKRQIRPAKFQDFTAKIIIDR